MKIFAVAVLGVAFFCLLPFTLGEANRYQLALEEKGTPFLEEIDVDEEQDVEVFRVPAHNNVEGADFYHDFKVRVTVTRISSRRVCYISELDSSLSSPVKLKADMDRASVQAGKLPVETESSIVMITGPANRLLLTKEILDFCGALPIYNTEHTKVDPSSGNGTAIIRKNRQKRDKIIKNHKSCLKTLRRDPFEYIKNGGCAHRDVNWDLTCRMQYRSMNCFYYVTCDNQVPVKLQWNCKSLHKSSRSPICCDFICP